MQTRQTYNSVPLQKSYSRIQKNFATSLLETMQILLQIAVIYSAGQRKRKADQCNFVAIKNLFGPV